MAGDDDFVVTIFSEDEAPLEPSDDESPAPSLSKKRKHNGESSISIKKRKKPSRSQTSSDDEEDNWLKKGEADGEIASDFEFDVDGGIVEDFDGWGMSLENGHTKSSAGDKKGVDIYDLISRRTTKADLPTQPTLNSGDEDEFGGFEEDELLAPDGFGMGAGTESPEDDEGQTESDEDADNDIVVNKEEFDSGNESVASPLAHPLDLASEASDDEKENPAEAKRRAAFFAPVDIDNSKSKKGRGKESSFLDMGLSRPILKGLSAIGFNEPTPIQRQAIPVALTGKDVVGGAVTGSGKTAAFLVPILERLVFRPKKIPTTRVAILMPTRELAVQCYNVATKIAKFTDIAFAQIVGGFSVREQEQVLKRRPDVIIATPGRFIDHMRNSAGFAVETLEILVLDEADRMLEDGFADELNEILKTIPKSRQTMLFSATMTEDVDKLIRAGLNRPVRLLVDAKKQTVSGLVQEFVRLRPGREDKRLAYLMWLCENVYKDRVIIFFRQKKEVHRVLVNFALCGFAAAELHGGITQEKRIQAVESFRSGEASYLLATDVASRGLDIKNVSTVLNYEAPQTHEIYLHRVGRTARAGRTGRACTIAAEPDRKVVKAAAKTARAQNAKIASRSVPPEEADAWAERLEKLKDEVEAVLAEEKELKALNIAERDITKGENLLIHEEEIKSRPKRTWFENEQQKKVAKDKGRVELNGEVALKDKKKKLSNKQKKKLDLKHERKEAPMWKKVKSDRGMKATRPGKAGSKTKTSKK